MRSEKTDFHGKAKGDYVIKDSLYTYFIINSVSTIGLFLISFYEKMFPKTIENDKDVDSFDDEDLPF